MSAFNVVRFRVKPGRDQEFIDAHRKATKEGFTGARRVALIKTGDNSYCVVGEWDPDAVRRHMPTPIVTLK